MSSRKRSSDIDRDAALVEQLARVADLLSARLTLRLDELAAEGAALRAYVQRELAQLDDGAKPFVSNCSDALSANVGARLERIDAMLDDVDRILISARGSEAGAQSVPWSLRRLGRSKGKRDGKAAGSSKGTEAALTILSAAIREVVQVQARILSGDSK